jgi:hypothetical protein
LKCILEGCSQVPPKKFSIQMRQKFFNSSLLSKNLDLIYLVSNFGAFPHAVPHESAACKALQGLPRQAGADCKAIGAEQGA